MAGRRTNQNDVQIGTCKAREQTGAAKNAQNGVKVSVPSASKLPQR